MMQITDRAANKAEPGPHLWSKLVKIAIVGLLVVSLIPVCLNVVVPRMMDSGGPAIRAGWYLRSRQWLADARTVYYVVKFVLERGPGLRFSASTNPDPSTNSAAVVVAQTNTPIALPRA